MHSIPARYSLSPLFKQLVLAGACLLPLTPGLALAAAQGMAPARQAEGISEYRLPNGLRVLLMPDASKPTVTVNMTYLVGSRQENYGETGMAHLLEHLMFKGTPKHPHIDAEFNKRGMRNNGTTSLDRTNYFELFQASDDNLKWALEMEADRMVHSFIAKKDLDTEMTVVRNEFENGENEPGNVLVKRLFSVAYDWHNYGHSTIGNRSDIENVKIENLQAFYRQYYQPDNAVLLVAGKFDSAKTLSWIQQSFSAIPRPKRSLPPFWTIEPTQDGERSVIVRRKGDYQMVMLAYKAPAALHADRRALNFAQSLLTTEPHGRLHKQLVETGKVVQVFSFGMGEYAPGLCVVGAVVKKDASIEAARDALLEGIEQFKNTPPSAEELSRIKRNELNAFEKTLNDPETVGIALSEYIALGDWRYLFKERDENEKIDATAIIQAAQKYLVRDNRTIGLFIPDDTPQRAEIPTAPSIETALRDYVPKAAIAQGEAFDPSPANIDARSERLDIDGLRVALLPKKNRGEAVNVSLSLHWGDASSLTGKRLLGGVANALLDTGTTRYTREQIADEMTRLKMSGDLFGFQTTRSNLAGALALVAHVLREANFPDQEFAQLRDKMLVAKEAGRSEPGAVAQEAMLNHFNRYPKDDFRGHSTLDETLAALKAMSAADVRAYHQQFYGASKGELSIIGDFDAKEAKDNVRAAFANWPSHAPYTRLERSHTEIAPVRQLLDTPDKENGFYLARLNLRLKESDADYVPLLVANYLFGGDAGLDSRLMERLRQKDGLSYGGSSMLSSGTLDDDGSFVIHAIAAPQNLLKVERDVREELERVRKEGFSEAELAKAKSGLLQNLLQERTQDGNLASGWADHLFYNRTWSYNQAMDARIQRVTLAEVNAAFQRIDPNQLSVFIAGDLKKGGIRP